MKKLYPHQQKFKDNAPRNALLCWSTGTGKTVAAVEWLKIYGGTHAFVLVPKRIKRKWQKELGDVQASVLTYEEFKKNIPRKVTAIVVDEADNFASPLFVPALRSQRSEALYELLRKNSIPTLLLTATPIRSAPHNLHTLLTFLGHNVAWPMFREKYYNLEKRPYLPRPAWLPKSTWRKDIQPALKHHAHIVTLKDCVGVLPPFTEVVTKVRAPKFEQTQWEPMAATVERHRHENGAHKVKTILEIAAGHRKAIVVCHFVEQCELYAKELAKNRPVYLVHGGVKDQEALLKEANEAEDCFLVIQASLSAGFDADSFECVVFASMSYRAVDKIQMKGRVTRIHNLHPVVYHYLISGKVDQAVYDTVEKSKDFIPSEWTHATTT